MGSRPPNSQALGSATQAEEEDLSGAHVQCWYHVGIRRQTFLVHADTFQYHRHQHRSILGSTEILHDNEHHL